MTKHIKAGVVIKTDWIRRNGLNDFLKGSFSTSTGNFVIRATDYNLGDYSFVEVEFCPESQKGRSTKIYIPRSEVEAI